ncbi:acyltransferase family protein [Ramlibacter algicola]|uniref:Acyltransferase n=1 Tax=Ramlibacter algicola TaxID=2795217 RepID=A0A934UPV9_9BURK|nr:acyltransferase [Ramlibacter algicola]
MNVVGCLRVFLALAVVLVHGEILPFTIFPADAAVQIFFMISGFYMALVLNTKYMGSDSNIEFYLGRVWRLAPTFLACALFALVLTSAGLKPHLRWHSPSDLPFSAMLLICLSQVVLVGQDAVHFLTVDGTSGLRFTSDFAAESLQLWQYLLIPQAWSLSVEVYFYLFAPLLLRCGPRILFAALVGSFFLRLFIAGTFGLRFDPWSYRFFPSELLFFVAGAIAYLASKRSVSMWLHVFAALLIFVATNVGRVGLGGRLFFLSPIVTTGVLFALPVLFSVTKNWEWDRRLGDLSYPIYVSHMLVISLGASIFPMRDVLFKTFVIVLVVLTSLALIRFVEGPLEQYRKSRRCRVALTATGV